jgi:hypothetical protein
MAATRGRLAMRSSPRSANSAPLVVSGSRILNREMMALEAQRELLHELASRAAGESLPKFSRYVFGLEPPRHVAPMIEGLEAIEAGLIRRLLLILPPGHAKSTFASIVFPCWYIGRHPAHHVLGISQTDRLAKLFGETVRSVIAVSDRFSRVFPKVVPDYERGWSQDGFFVRRPSAFFDKDPTGFYAGAGGPVIGRRTEGLVIDDPIDQAVARSELELATRKEWMKQTAFSRLKPGGWAIASGTIWVEDDVMDTFAKSGDWIEIRVKALSDSKRVFASVSIPDAVEWRPTGWIAGEPISDAQAAAIRSLTERKEGKA